MFQASGLVASREAIRMVRPVQGWLQRDGTVPSGTCKGWDWGDSRLLMDAVLLYLQVSDLHDL